ncbi:hypothetical protein ABGT15_07540 [Flavobacterium enshiense]|uniref:hypothetical protein n=1 Tax=Flavobacterium enshiense TaxID=1341165 RepID=UPI00345D6726
MKLKFTLAVLLFVSFLQAQSLSELQQDTKKVYDANYTMDFNTILDYTYPKVYDIVDKKTMYETLDKTFQNEEFGIRFVYPNPKFTFSDIRKIDNQSFCVVSYHGAIRMKFEEKLDDQTSKRMLDAFQISMRGKKVSFEKDRNSFLIEGNNIMIAVTDTLTQNKWKFLNYDPNQIDFLNKIVSETIRKQLGLQ